eukprot:9116014-Lingulodinium_polyedra.AAC.3
MADTGAAATPAVLGAHDDKAEMMPCMATRVGGSARWASTARCTTRLTRRPSCPWPSRAEAADGRLSAPPCEGVLDSAPLPLAPRTSRTRRTFSMKGSSSKHSSDIACISSFVAAPVIASAASSETPTCTEPDQSRRVVTNQARAPSSVTTRPVGTSMCAWLIWNKTGAWLNASSVTFSATESRIWQVTRTAASVSTSKGNTFPPPENVDVKVAVVVAQSRNSGSA